MRLLRKIEFLGTQAGRFIGDAQTGQVCFSAAGEVRGYLDAGEKLLALIIQLQ